MNISYWCYVSLRVRPPAKAVKTLMPPKKMMGSFFFHSLQLEQSMVNNQSACEEEGCCQPRACHKRDCHYAQARYCRQHSCPRCLFRQPVTGHLYCLECRWSKGSTCHWCYEVPNKLVCKVEGCSLERKVHGGYCGEHSCKHCANRREVLSDICSNCDCCYYNHGATRGAMVFALRKLQERATVLQDKSILHGVVHLMKDDTFRELMEYMY